MMQKRPRRDKGVSRWNQRDLWLLRWIGAQYVVRVDQLQQLLSRWPMGKTLEEGQVGEATTRHWIERWTRMGLLEYATILAHQPGWVWLTRKGLRTLELPYRYWIPNPGKLRHLYYINKTRLRCEDLEDKPTWVSERQLDNQRGLRKRGEQMGHLPDAELRWSDGEIYCVEVELSRKKESWLKDILEQDARTYDSVWYYVLPQVKDAVWQAINALPNEDPFLERFDVEELDETW